MDTSRNKLAMAGVMLALATAGVAQAAIVFDAEFDGSIANPSNPIVNFGGTGSLPAPAGTVNTVAITNPFASGSGGYLQSVVTASATGQKAFATFTPTTMADNGWGALVGTPIAGQGAFADKTYLNLRGGFDMFFRLDAGSLTDMGWLRPIDYNRKQNFVGAAGLRLIFNSNNAKLLQLDLQTDATAGAGALATDAGFTVGAGAQKVFSAVNKFTDLTLGEVQHIGFTFETALDGQITAKMFFADGNLAINPISDTPAASLQFYGDSSKIGTTPFAGATTWNDQGNAPVTPPWPDTTLSQDGLRIYSSVPNSFAALPVPEPASLGLLTLGGLGLLARRQRKNRTA